MSEVEEKREEATFYCWNDKLPASETIRISGGERQKDANGNILALGLKEAHFVMGLCRTDDPETIRELRRIIKKGKPDMSEDKEKYLSAVLPPEKKSERATALLSAKEQELEQERRETSRLRTLLEEKAAKEPRGRTAKASDLSE